MYEEISLTKVNLLFLILLYRSPMTIILFAFAFFASLR